MIQIRKPKSAPAILRTRGRQASAQLKAQYDSTPDSYRSGSCFFRSSDFDARIYGAPEVKNALRKAQHGKCAFCESRIDHIAPGDVEHFRPKAGYRRHPDGALVRPGYYWLAYDWSNLFFCCPLCNQRFKRNHFPLADEDRRATSHHEDIEREQPLLIHPERDDPSNYLEFEQEYIRAIGGNARGQATIRILGLNRPEIVEKRRDALKSLVFLIECRDLVAEQVEEAPSPEGRRRLVAIDDRLTWYAEKARSASAEYAAMLRDALKASRQH